jgi:heme A synthase
MDKTLHPVATEHRPAFITAPGDTDVLMVVGALILLLAVVAFGVLFLTLHTLPERMAHKSRKLQFEIVAVLGLLALFTHMHAFWVAGLLLALIDFPDIGGWLGRIAASVEKIADTGSRDQPPDKPDNVARENVTSIRRGDGGAPASPELAPRSAGG